MGVGGQTTVDCGDKYCQRGGQNYQNPAIAQGEFTPQCRESPYSCSGAVTSGWYCSTLNPNVALLCAGHSSAGNLPMEERPCGLGYRCQTGPGGRNQALVVGGNPSCVSTPQ